MIFLDTPGVTIRAACPKYVKMMDTRSFFVLALCVAVATADDFETWARGHGKRYSLDEKAVRARIFEKNSLRVREHNAAFDRNETSYAMSMTGPFADLTFAEFSDLHLMSPQNCSATHISSGPVPIRTESLPKSVDWRTRGALLWLLNEWRRNCFSAPSTSAQLSASAWGLL